MNIHPDHITIDGNQAIWTIPGPPRPGPYPATGIPAMLAELIVPVDTNTGGRKPFVIEVGDQTLTAVISEGPHLIDGNWVTTLTLG